MRISGGTSAGRLLKVPKGFDVRPTPDLVRQAIFNSLGPRVVGTEVLELFGGTGALSLEALSRGAVQALCVEKSGKHARFIRQNLKDVGLDESRFDLWIKDAFAALRMLRGQGRAFDLIFADPPFGDKNVGRRSTSFTQKLLDDDDLPRLLRSGGLLVLGHARRDELTVTDAWEERKYMKHGDSAFRFLARPGV